MAWIIRLAQSNWSQESLAQLLAEAPRVSSLREAVDIVMRAIHGLPEIMGCELSQLEVYLGRATANPNAFGSAGRPVSPGSRDGGQPLP